MAGGNEDCASVLEQFIHDAANLPAEVNYMMEEIQAIDKEMQKYISQINKREKHLQDHVKNNGALAPFAKEQEYTDFAKRHYDTCVELQAKKITHSEKACTLLDRQLKRLDVKIRELQNDGQLTTDGPPLPSIFNRKPDTPKQLADIPPTNMPLQAASISSLNASALRANAQITPIIRQPQPRQISQVTSTTVPPQRSSAPATPAATVQIQKQAEREHSAGADSKRRKLNTSTSGINLPAQPSGLRQSSLGPGTPKAGTPTGSRAGSIPRTLGAQTTAGIKKTGPTKKVPHAQVAKLKNKHKAHARLSQGRKKGGSPSVRSGRAGTAASEEDSVLSSADASDTDASQSRSRRKKKAGASQPAEESRDADMEDEDVEEGDDDDTRYCFCNQRSYGEMVACENEDCQYQWFHTGCLKMTKVPDEDEDWYCPECRKKPEILAKMNAGKLRKK